jgi:hypothetical protein
VYFSGVQPAVREMLARTGVLRLAGEDRVFWSADQAIIAVHRHHEETGCGHCRAHPEEIAAVQAVV